MNLPNDEQLPIHLLAACFNKTSATYKFYWLLSLLNQVEQGKAVIYKHHLFADMIAQSWFTVNYFHVSFGKQDKLQQAIQNIKSLESLTIDAERNQIFKTLINSNRLETAKVLWYFNTEVPHRFLSPWLKADDMRTVQQYSQNFSNKCLYALDKDSVTMNPVWLTYLTKNAGIIKAFCYWHLALYLQSKNPNVPDIPNKLIKTPQRKSLNAQRKFWVIVINELGSVNCIYTHTPLTVDSFAVEHFVPYAFVSHNLIWNLIPADRSFNSSKSDKLPSLEKFFDPFFDLQYQAIEIVKDKFPKNKLLEDYTVLFPLIGTEQLDRQKFREQIQPLVTIASNNGFEYLKTSE